MKKWGQKSRYLTTLVARKRCAASRDASDTPPSLTAALEHPAHAVCTRGLLRRPNYQRGGEFRFSLRPRSASTVARSKLTLLPRDPSKEFDREATADYPRTTGLQGGGMALHRDCHGASGPH